jgi:hypothetical protein
VGTNYTPKYSITFNSGHYSYGPEPTNVTATYMVTDSLGNSLTSATGTFDTITIDDDTNYYIDSTISYSAGAVPKTNL